MNYLRRVNYCPECGKQRFSKTGRMIELGRRPPDSVAVGNRIMKSRKYLQLVKSNSDP